MFVEEIEDIEDFDHEESENQQCAFTTDDLKVLAKHYLKVFFDKISPETDIESLYNDRNISMTLNMNICDDLPLLYEVLPKDNDSDIAIVLEKLNQCAKLGLPKCFAVGIIAIYLETCKGYKIDFEV